MTLFEYLAIAYSLVLSFAVLRAASGLPHALASGRRYWVHSLWLVSILTVSVVIFWVFWSFRGVEWSLGSFVLVLANPTLMYIAASILVPEEPARVESWREHFYATRLRLFVTGMSWVVVVFLIATVVIGMPLTHPARLAQLMMFGIYATGAVTERPQVHAVLAILPYLVLLSVALPYLTRPGAVAPGP